MPMVMGDRFGLVALCATVVILAGCGAAEEAPPRPDREADGADLGIGAAPTIEKSHAAARADAPPARLRRRSRPSAGEGGGGGAQGFIPRPFDP